MRNGTTPVTAKRKTAQTGKPIDRNLRGLADALFDEIDALRNGDGSAERVRQVCNVSGRIVLLLNTEMRLRRLSGMEGPNDKRVKQITG